MPISNAKTSSDNGQGRQKAGVPSVNRSRVEEITCFDDDDDDLGRPIEYYSRFGQSGSEVTKVKSKAGRQQRKETIKIDDENDKDHEYGNPESSIVNELHGELTRLRKEVCTETCLYLHLLS